MIPDEKAHLPYVKSKPQINKCLGGESLWELVTETLPIEGTLIQKPKLLLSNWKFGRLWVRS